MSIRPRPSADQYRDDERGNERSKVLSPREYQIALLIGRGLSNKDVARKLGLSPGTVKIHVHNIFVKLGEKSRHRIIVEHDK